jgi:hypothetical protein
MKIQDVREIAVAHSVDEANALLRTGWRLLEIVTRHVVWPKYILGAATHDVEPSPLALP